MTSRTMSCVRSVEPVWTMTQRSMNGLTEARQRAIPAASFFTIMLRLTRIRPMAPPGLRSRLSRRRYLQTIDTVTLAIGVELVWVTPIATVSPAATVTGFNDVLLVTSTFNVVTVIAVENAVAELFFQSVTVIRSAAPAADVI